MIYAIVGSYRTSETGCFNDNCNRKGVRGMHIQKKRKVCRNAMGIITLFVAVMLSGLSVGAHATGGAMPVPQFQHPFAFKQYHVHYDVNADGTYKEQGDFAITVLNEQGVQLARQMPVGMQNMPMFVTDQNVEIATAYTLKRNGEHIAAIPVNSAPVAGVVPAQMKVFAFQQVEIGDTLVLSYQAMQKRPIIPNNVVLDQQFSKFVAYDDAVISLSAPASMNLRVEISGVGKGQNTTGGKIQKWEWQYRNKPPAALSPNQPPPLDRIHVSSFKDNQAESEAIQAEIEATKKLITALQPPAFQPQIQASQHCQVFPSNPNDGPEALNMFTAQVADFFWRSEDFLKREVNDWNIPTCVFDDGRPRLSALLDGYDQAFRNESDWSKSLARVDYLKKKFPNQAFVALAEVKYWIEYAWNARGGGYASSVSKDGWKLFRERLERAERILIDTKSYSADLPNWYSEMIIVQSALDRPEDERDQVFLEGVKRFPTFYPIYFTMLNYLSPKWGGTWRTVDNLVKWSVEHTKAEESNSMYARIYWAAAGDPKVNLFKDTFATWSKMKHGFENLMVRHPKSKWNLNNFAKFACMAGDKQTFLKLRSQIGKDVIDAAWPDNTSLDLCETKFGYAE